MSGYSFMFCATRGDGKCCVLLGFLHPCSFCKRELKEPGVLTLFDSQVKNLCRVSKTVDKIDDYLKKIFFEVFLFCGIKRWQESGTFRNIISYRKCLRVYI